VKWERNASSPLLSMLPEEPGTPEVQQRDVAKLSAPCSAAQASTRGRAVTWVLKEPLLNTPFASRALHSALDIYTQ